MKASVFDVIALAGFGLLIWGVARLSISAALIVGGALIFYFGFVMSQRPTE